MREAAAIGARIGCTIDQDPDARHAVARELGAFKISMLLDAELGLRTGVPTPNIDALLGLTRLFARGRGLYNPPEMERRP
jgi:2-dehydropantoate 2-reductase